MLASNRAFRGFFHFQTKDGSYYAAAIAFYLLFAMTPFLLLTLAIAALFTSTSSGYLDVFNAFFKANFPQGSEPLRNALLGVFENRSRLGIVSLVWLFLVARKLMGAIEKGLNTMMEIEKPRSGVLSTLASIALIFFASVLMLASSLAMVAVDFASGIEVSFLGGTATTIAGIVLKALFSGAVSIALFYGIYRLAPSKGLPSRDAFLASAFATVMWLSARHVFVWFASRQLAKYEWMYSSFATFLWALLWAYMFGVALLMGACMVGKRAA